MPYKDKNKQKEAQKQHYLNNRKAYSDSLKSRRKARAEFVQNIKRTKFCEICGETNVFCLDFHHKEKKTDTITMAVRNAWPENKILEEIEKCIILCSNCHRKNHDCTFVVRKSARVQKLKDWLIDYKVAHPCKCGESRACCLDFHHEQEKDMTISHMLAYKYPLKTIQEEVEKCMVMCSNCHRVFHNGNNWNDKRCYGVAEAHNSV